MSKRKILGILPPPLVSRLPPAVYLQSYFWLSVHNAEPFLDFAIRLTLAIDQPKQAKPMTVQGTPPISITLT